MRWILVVAFVGILPAFSQDNPEAELKKECETTKDVLEQIACKIKGGTKLDTRGTRVFRTLPSTFFPSIDSQLKLGQFGVSMQ